MVRDQDFRERRQDYMGGHRYRRRRGYDSRERHSYPEDARFSRNYKEDSLYPREHRGYRDERNYARKFYPSRRNYYPRGRYADSRPRREPTPTKEDMNKALIEYMSVKK